MWIELWIEVWVWISTNRRHRTGTDWRRLSMLAAFLFTFRTGHTSFEGACQNTWWLRQREASSNLQSLHFSARGFVLIMGIEQSAPEIDSRPLTGAWRA